MVLGLYPAWVAGSVVTRGLEETEGWEVTDLKNGATELTEGTEKVRCFRADLDFTEMFRTAS